MKRINDKKKKFLMRKGLQPKQRKNMVKLEHPKVYEKHKKLESNGLEVLEKIGQFHN
jgi:hypothetical protein